MIVGYLCSYADYAAWGFPLANRRLSATPIYAILGLMHIIFDARYIRTDHHDGISRFSAELLQGLAPLCSQAGDTLSALIHDDGQRRFLPLNVQPIYFHPPTSPKEPLSALLLNTYQPDIVFSPMQTIGSFGKKFKLILTVHDLIYYTYPQPPRNLSWPVRALWRLYHLSYWPQKQLLRGANSLVVVSNETANQVRKAGLYAGEIDVVYNAAAPEMMQLGQGRPSAFTPEKAHHIIYMGSFMPYKNVENIVRAAAFLPKHYTVHFLSRIRPAEKERYEAIFRDARGSDKLGAQLIFHNGVSDADYIHLLRHGALISASLTEGYGVPIAEAQALGVPVLCSNIPIFKEVAGNAALYFDPRLPADIAAKIQMLESEMVFKTLASRSIMQSRRFSWGASAKRLFTIIHEHSGR